MQYASEALKTDRDFVLKAVNVQGPALEYVADHLRADEGLVKAAIPSPPPPDLEQWKLRVSRDWRKLEIAPQEIKADYNAVAGAIQDSWGQALQHASVELQSNRDLVLLAARADGRNLRYVAE